MTRHTGPRGLLGSSDVLTADRRPRSRPHRPGAAAEGVLREMAFVLHLARSVKAAMTGPEAWAAARPE